LAPTDGEGRNQQIRPNPGLGRADRVLFGPCRTRRAPGAQWRASGRSRAQEHAGGTPVGPLGPRLTVWVEISKSARIRVSGAFLGFRM